ENKHRLFSRRRKSQRLACLLLPRRKTRPYRKTEPHHHRRPLARPCPYDRLLLGQNLPVGADLCGSLLVSFSSLCLLCLFGPLCQFFGFSFLPSLISNSSAVFGQSSLNNLENARSANSFPPVWHFGQ